MAAPNQSELSRKDRLAWKELLATPNRERAAFAILLAALQMLVLPFCEDERLLLPYLLLSLGAYYLLTRSFRAILELGIPAFLLYSLGVSYFGNGTAPTVAFLAILLGGAFCGYVLLHFHSKPVHLCLLAIPLLTWGLTFLLTGDPMRGLLSLLPLPLGAVFAFLMLRCTGLTETTLSGATAVALTLAVALLLTLAATGRLYGNALAVLAEEMRAGIVQVLSGVRELYEQMGLTSITDVTIANTATTMVNLIPAYFLIVCSVLSFLSYRVFLHTILSLDELGRMPRRVMALTVSPITAVLFLVTFLLSLLVGNDHASFFAVLLQNLYLTLEPVLILIGFSSLFGRGTARSCLSVFLLLGLCFILFTNPDTGLTLVAFYGALSVLIARFFPAPDEKGGS